MKLLILFAFVALAAARPDDNHYDSKFDNFDIDEVLNNDRLRSSYVKCFNGDGKCTPEGKDISKLIPEGTTTSCAKCTPKQKNMVAKFMKVMQEKHAEEWQTLQTKIDPEGKYTENMKKFVAEFA